MGAPLTLGYGDGETYLGSDALALAALTQRIAYLDEGDWAVVTNDGARSTTAPTSRSSAKPSFPAPPPPASRRATTATTCRRRFSSSRSSSPRPAILSALLRAAGRAADMDFSFADVPRITIVACGTSYYAGMVAKYWLEQFARVPCELDIASEFRYRQPCWRKGGLALFISQSGETADTLAALRHAREHGQRIAVVVNVPTSSMAREADCSSPPAPARKSALPRPRPSPASSQSSPRSPPRWRATRAG
jgi:glucosamine--fructose-6-phosphate aminotransferase (isomerizing)